MKKMLALLLCCCFVLSACNIGSPVSDSFWAMDTYMQLDLYGSQETLDKVRNEIHRLDALLSTTNEDSDIFALNQSGSATVDEAVADLITESLALCGALDGALDISVYPIVEEWGFISKNYQIPTQKTLEELLERVNYEAVSADGSRITLEGGMKLDLGSVAKGFAADRSREILEEDGVKSAILNLGGTVLAYGEKLTGEAWKVGIADPENSAAHFGYVACRDKVAATSGGYERYFVGDDGKTYCHIIDPKTGYPADNEIVSVSVISESGIKCDALSTALFVMGLDGAIAYWKSAGDFDFVILDKSDTVYVSKGIASGFKLTEGYDFEIKVVESY